MSKTFSRSESSEKNSVWGVHAISVGYIVTLYVSSFVLEVFVVMPFLFQESSTFYLHLVPFVYCMMNIVCYYYSLISVDVSCETSAISPRNSGDQKASTATGCYFCQSCQRNSPPRAHHCNTCGKCIDRRDHHCYFIANCIGFANLRYFIVLNFFAGIVTIYVVVINLMYLHENIGPLSPLSIEGILKLIPVVTLYKWYVGKVALFYLTVVMVTWFVFVQVFVSFLCGTFQMRLLFTGQTTYEYSHNVHTYNRGWRHNYQEIFGKFWYVQWLLPVFPVKSLVCSNRSEDTYVAWQDDQPRKIV